MQTSLQHADLRKLGPPSRPGLRAYGKALAAAIVLANAAVIVWLWYYDGGVTGVHSFGELCTSLGRITGLLGMYLLLWQVLLLARMRLLDRLVGFDTLVIWHRLNGMVCLYLILAHVALISIGYSLTDRISLPAEISTLLSSYPGMVQASFGTGLLLVVVISSLVVVRRHARYETWYFVHLTAYLAIYLPTNYPPETSSF
jgi:predicted ferric reductase